MVEPHLLSMCRRLTLNLLDLWDHAPVSYFSIKSSIPIHAPSQHQSQENKHLHDYVVLCHTLCLYSACFISFSHSSAFFHSLNFCFLVSTPFSTSSHHHQVYLCLHLPFLTPQTVSCNFSHCFFNLVPLFLNSHTVLNIYIPFL